MQTRFTEKYSNIITGIIDSPDPRIQHALTQQMHTNCLRNATTEELTIAIRDNHQHVNFLRETIKSYGVIQTNGIVNDDVTNVLAVIAENIEIQRTPLPVPQQRNASTAAHSR
jgi:hypothetical protein